MYFIQTQNVIAGHNEFYKVPLPTNEKALMTSYAYPMDASILKRSSLIASHPKQYVYAGIEDGTLYRIEIINEKKPELLLTVGAGDIDTLVEPLKNLMNNA